MTMMILTTWKVLMTVVVMMMMMFQVWIVLVLAVITMMMHQIKKKNAFDVVKKAWKSVNPPNTEVDILQRGEVPYAPCSQSVDARAL